MILFIDFFLSGNSPFFVLHFSYISSLFDRLLLLAHSLFFSLTLLSLSFSYYSTLLPSFPAFLFPSLVLLFFFFIFFSLILSSTALSFPFSFPFSSSFSSYLLLIPLLYYCSISSFVRGPLNTDNSNTEK